MTTTNKYLSLALITALWGIFLPSGCKEGKKNDPISKEGMTKIVAVYTKKDSSKVLDIMLRQITKVIKYDSIHKRDVVVIDTLYGWPLQVPLVDSVGRQKKDTLGRPLFRPEPAYIQIGKDSVRWRISGIPLDSLLKK